MRGFFKRNINLALKGEKSLQVWKRSMGGLDLLKLGGDDFGRGSLGVGVKRPSEAYEQHIYACNMIFARINSSTALWF